LDRDTRAFVAALLAENATLAEQAGLALAIAALLQQLLHNHAVHLGLPDLGPTLPLPVLQDCARRLAVRLTPPDPPPGPDAADGTRIAVGAGAAKGDSSAE
jgi:hypothetical protein